VGETVDFEVTEPVINQNYVVIQKGAVALGRVTKVETKRRFGRAGALELSIDSVRLTDGRTYRSESAGRAELNSQHADLAAGRRIELDRAADTRGHCIRARQVERRVSVGRHLNRRVLPAKGAARAANEAVSSANWRFTLSNKRRLNNNWYSFQALHVFRIAVFIGNPVGKL
jgi:hypothetical protein